MKITYRPEIDGMRTIAVIAVLVYHLKIPYGDGEVLPGGFLGVDLFFVLSGFLITKILLRELTEKGRIDFGNFYARRARRIMPPLLMVMLASLAVAWTILLPGELTRFSMSLLATLAFASNIYWFFELGEYGSQSGLLQPFLHTWSLSIEEQFYLVFPVILIGLSLVKRRYAIGFGIVLLIIFSLILAHFTSVWNPNLSFFSPISRAWELLAGSGLAYVSTISPNYLRNNRAARFVPAAAVLVLAVYFLTFSLQEWTHPGLPVLPFILASCALLWFAQRGEPVTDLLSTRPFVFIGKLSYSIYLWHFPVFAFGRLSVIDQVSTLDWLTWLGITFALSIAGYYFVEKPFRFRLPTVYFVASIAIAIGVIGVSAGMTRNSDVLTGDRLAKLNALYGANNYDNEALLDMSWSVLDSLDPNEKIETWNAHQPSEHEKNGNWFLSEDSRKVLILGNSHSKDVFNAVTLNLDAFDGLEFARFGMRNDFPQEQLEDLFRSPNFEKSDVVAIAPQYASAHMSRVLEIVETLQSLGKEVVIIGNTAQFQSPRTDLPVFDWYLRHQGNEASLSELNSVAYRFEVHEVDQINTALRQIAEDVGASYSSRRDLICQNEKQTCTLITPNGRKSMYDYGHWTLEGAQHFGREAARNGWFR